MEISILNEFFDILKETLNNISIHNQLIFNFASNN